MELGLEQRWTFVPLTIRGEWAVVWLNAGLYALVDEADWTKVGHYRWTRFPCRSRRHWYAIASVRGKRILLHRLILKTPKGFDIDHIDGNGLHNQRSNLRVCTRRENMMNFHASKGLSKFRGVCWDGESGKWQAIIKFGSDRSRNLGRFPSEALAAAAYDAELVRRFGPNVKTNHSFYGGYQ